MRHSSSLIEEQIPSIRERIRIEQDLGFFLDAKWYQANEAVEGRKSNVDLPARLNCLIEKLLRTCYHRFFCGLTDGQIDAPLPSLKDRQEFMMGLSEVNNASRKSDVNWQIIETDAFGLSYAVKDGIRRPLLPGTYTAQKKRAGWVNFLRMGEDRIEEPTFYHALSDAYFDQNEEQACYYWNIAPEGVSRLLEELTASLNLYHIPYRFKCLNHPELYTRTTTAMLFVLRAHGHLVEKLMQSINHSRIDFLMDEVPLFTNRLSIGFSTSPVPLQGGSFGEYIMAQLAQRLVREQCFGLQSPLDVELNRYDFKDRMVQSIT